VPGEFNFPRLCNAGVAAAKGRVVVLLNNDTDAPEEDWLDELVSLAIRRGIGAVGPLMMYPNGFVQSAGVLLGVNRSATSALAGFDPDDAVARAWCASRRRVSAVVGACLAVERGKYFGVGGFDERFAVSHNEVDFCLRLEAAGFSNLFTPFASIVHEEGATRGFELMPVERERLASEEALFRARWGSLMGEIDPAHHPCLAREGNPVALAATVSDLRPRAGWRVYHAAARAGIERPSG
jgi:GT2 family glycosyltransferase